MAYQIDWLVPNRIVYVYAYDQMTPTDVESWLGEIYHLFDKREADKNAFAYTIINTVDVTEQQVKIGDWRRIFNAYADRARPGWSVTIAPSVLHRFWASLATQFLHINNVQAKDIDEALTMLGKVDSDLPDYDDLIARYQEVHHRLSEIGTF